MDCVVSVRRLRDACCVDSVVQGVSADDIEELCGQVMADVEEECLPLARASAQCLANLAAAGAKAKVWSGLFGVVASVLKRWPRDEGNGRADGVRAAAVAALHNCVCGEDHVSRGRALELAGQQEVVELLLRGCWHERHDETEWQTSSDEWTYLLTCALLRRGAATIFFRSFTLASQAEAISVFSEEEEKWSSLVQIGLKMATDCVDSEDDGVFCAEDDVAAAACAWALRQKEVDEDAAMEGGPHSRRFAPQFSSLELAVRLAADAAGLGPKRRAEALRDAGALDLVLKCLRPFPIPALKLLANIAYLDVRVRDDAKKVLPNVLERCTVDPKKPLQREWAIFAIRNLCAGNQSNQDFIESLKPQALHEASVASLKSLGINGARLHTNPDTGKTEVKVSVVRPPSKQNQPEPPGGPPTCAENDDDDIDPDFGIPTCFD